MNLVESSLLVPTPLEAVSSGSVFNPEFESLISRINQVIQKKQEECLGNNSLEAFKCSILHEVTKDPVITCCSHLFDKTALANWRKQHSTCPICRSSLKKTSLNPLPKTVQDFVSELQQEVSVPVFSESKIKDPSLNATLARNALDSAQIYALQGEFEEAIDSYKKAFKHINTSEDYEAVPLLYESMHTSEGDFKAVLSSLYLALYQFKEAVAGEKLEGEKVAKAVATLKHCKEMDPTLKVDFLTISLDLLLDSSQEKIEQILPLIEDLQDLEEAISLYRQIILKAPYTFVAYESLAFLLEKPEEKKQLFLQAAVLAEEKGDISLGAVFRWQAEGFSKAMTIDKWGDPAQFLRSFPPYPKKLQDFLDGPCPLVRGEKKKVKDTHVVMPLFKKISCKYPDGEEVDLPMTLERLHILEKGAGGAGLISYVPIFEKPLEESFLEEPFEWIVMPKKLLSKSLDQSYEKQKELVEKRGYEVPTPLEAASCILWDYRLNPSSSLYNSGKWTICNQAYGEGHIIIGCPNSDGHLRIHAANKPMSTVGVVGVRRFKAVEQYEFLNVSERSV